MENRRFEKSKSVINELCEFSVHFCDNSFLLYRKAQRTHKVLIAIGTQRIQLMFQNFSLASFILSSSLTTGLNLNEYSYLSASNLY
jgi:hypothetical protein